MKITLILYILLVATVGCCGCVDAHTSNTVPTSAHGANLPKVSPYDGIWVALGSTGPNATDVYKHITSCGCAMRIAGHRVELSSNDEPRVVLATLSVPLATEGGISAINEVGSGALVAEFGYKLTSKEQLNITMSTYKDHKLQEFAGTIAFVRADALASTGYKLLSSLSLIELANLRGVKVGFNADGSIIVGKPEIDPVLTQSIRDRSAEMLKLLDSDIYFSNMILGRWKLDDKVNTKIINTKITRTFTFQKNGVVIVNVYQSGLSDNLTPAALHSTASYGWRIKESKLTMILKSFESKHVGVDNVGITGKADVHPIYDISAREFSVGVTRDGDDGAFVGSRMLDINLERAE
jgi:hypothetical protein